MDLPAYTNAEIMKKRLLIAISLCGEIDDDGQYMRFEERVGDINNDMTEGVADLAVNFMDPANFDNRDSPEE